MSGAARGLSYCHSGHSFFRKFSDVKPQQGRRAGELQVAGASGAKIQGPWTDLSTPRAAGAGCGPGCSECCSGRRAGRPAGRRGQLRISGPELDDLAHQAAADAVVAIIGKIGQFRGESRLTTRAYTFAMFSVSSKNGRHFWRHPPSPLDTEDWERLPDRPGMSRPANTSGAIFSALCGTRSSRSRPSVSARSSSPSRCARCRWTPWAPSRIGAATRSIRHCLMPGASSGRA